VPKVSQKADGNDWNSSPIHCRSYPFVGIMAERSNTSAAEQENTSSKRPPWWKRLWRWMGFGETKLWDWLQLPSTLAMTIMVAVIPC